MRTYTRLFFQNTMYEKKELYQVYDCVDMEGFSKKLDDAIMELPSKSQKIFKLSRFQKMTYKEIAKQDRISEKMVEKHISKALAKIREKVKNTPPILF